jgi:hypothetical protein
VLGNGSVNTLLLLPMQHNKGGTTADASVEVATCLPSHCKILEVSFGIDIQVLMLHVLSFVSGRTWGISGKFDVQL